ncbi:nucleotide sugar dehydrogenase [Gammaproteobacteria bacterium]|nr:nucleotide sugar dehydrogenase [Gammaproteobacteria bacterium]
MINLAIIGTGYVGLVSGVCLASKGHKVTCFDINEHTVDQLDKGICHIYENDLEDLLASSKPNISFEVLNDSSESQLMNFDAVLVAVGTPTVNNKTDLSQIESVGHLMGKLIKESDKYITIIIKSTVIPGTTDTFFKDIIEKESGKKLGDFGLGMNPEFLREGNAVGDFLEPDRIVLGHEDAKTLEILKDIYIYWDCEKVSVNTRSAEMMKYVNNALLATLISTVNEYSNIARKIGNIDFDKVMHGVHLDNRWSPIDMTGKKIKPKIIDYLKPGCGYGGSCFPKDVMAITALADDIGVEPKILKSVINVNENQPKVIIEILQKEVSNLENKCVLVLGLAFKPETDDVRDSVSLKLLDLLRDKVKNLAAHDPIATQNAMKSLGPNTNINFINNWKDYIAHVDVIIIATNWNEYVEIKSLNAKISGKVLLDTRSLFVASELPNLTYLSVN